MNNIHKLAKEKILIMDGAMGTEIQKLALKESDFRGPLLVNSEYDQKGNNDILSLTQPALIKEIHLSYCKAGADIIETNTFSSNSISQADYGNENLVLEMNIKSAQIAREVANDFSINHSRNIFVAGAIGPLVASYRPELCPPAAEAEALYADIVAALAPHVDVFILETMCSADQAEGLLRATGKTDTPSWLAVSVDDFNGKTLRSGEPLEALKPVLDRHKPDAVLINCARPEAVNEGLEILKDFGLPFGAYANGFTKITDGFLTEAPTVDALQERQDLDPKAYATHAMGWVAQGASIIGGCCEVGPAHIAEIAKQLSQNGYRII